MRGKEIVDIKMTDVSDRLRHWQIIQAGEAIVIDSEPGDASIGNGFYDTPSVKYPSEVARQPYMQVPVIKPRNRRGKYFGS